MKDEQLKVDFLWLESHPHLVKAIKGFDPRKPDKWSWCWGDGFKWCEAFTLQSAIAAAREANR
jgi:hypothetical protein